MACKCRRWQAVATAAPGPGGVTRRLRVTGECECPPENGPPTVRATDLITEDLVVLDLVAGPVEDPGTARRGSTRVTFEHAVGSGPKRVLIRTGGDDVTLQIQDV